MCKQYFFFDQQISSYPHSEKKYFKWTWKLDWENDFSVLNYIFFWSLRLAADSDDVIGNDGGRVTLLAHLVLHRPVHDPALY